MRPGMGLFLQLRTGLNKLTCKCQYVPVIQLTNLYDSQCLSLLGYWHHRADERHGNPPPSYQELLVVRDKVGRPPGEFGVSKSMECDIFPSVL